MRFSEHPFWFAGFRAFFTLACFAGMAFPILWVLVLAGEVTFNNQHLTSLQWHAHEMFFGFGWAVMGGFLLTSTKNWVKVRGYHGKAIIVLATAWFLERSVLWFASDLPPMLFRLASNLFMATIITMLLLTLLRHRKTDGYRSDNVFFLLLLPTFLLAKNLLLSESAYSIGLSMTLGLFRLALLIMLERTLTDFMRILFKVDILRRLSLDRSIKLLAMVLVFETLLPQSLTITIAVLLAVLLLLRFVFWKPQLAMRRLDVGIMYIGYLALVAQLLIPALTNTVHATWIGNVSVHLFSFGVMGLIIPAMLIRICNGHTGRKVVFTLWDKAVLWIMLGALVCRVFLPQYLPEAYMRWIELSAAAWFMAFAILAWRYIPYLMQKRVDGREH